MSTDEAIAFHGGDAFLHRVGEAQTHEANASDPGSDDLIFTWEFDDTSATSTYFNDGEGPDPDRSPTGHFPFSATDAVSVEFPAGVAEFVVTVEDDDGGQSSDSLPAVVVDTYECARSQGFWRHQFGRFRLSGVLRAQELVRAKDRAEAVNTAECAEEEPGQGGPSGRAATARGGRR